MGQGGRSAALSHMSSLIGLRALHRERSEQGWTAALGTLRDSQENCGGLRTLSLSAEAGAGTYIALAHHHELTLDPDAPETITRSLI